MFSISSRLSNKMSYTDDESIVKYAKIAEQAERYDDMAKVSNKYANRLVQYCS